MSDRGHKKWTSLMLPEHVHLLENMWDERDRLTHRPELADDAIEDLNRTLQQARTQANTIRVQFYQAMQIHQVEGVVANCSNTELRITGKDIFRISLSDILAVELIDTIDT